MTGLAIGEKGIVEISIELKSVPTSDQLAAARENLENEIGRAAQGPGFVLNFNYVPETSTLEILIGGPCIASIDEINAVLLDAGVSVVESKVGVPTHRP
jgi:hypothetical protein